MFLVEELDNSHTGYVFLKKCIQSGQMSACQAKSAQQPTLKPEGKGWNSQGEVNGQVLDWIKDNIPRSEATKGLWMNPPKVIGRGYSGDDSASQSDLETARGSWAVGQPEDNDDV